MMKWIIQNEMKKKKKKKVVFSKISETFQQIFLDVMPSKICLPKSAFQNLPKYACQNLPAPCLKLSRQPPPSRVTFFC